MTPARPNRFNRSVFAKINYDFFTVSAVAANGHPPVNAPAVKITSVTNSSLEVQPGSLFVPLADKRDGHDFIADALKRGAVAAFARRGHAVLKSLTEAEKLRLILVDDPLIALGKLAAFHRRRFAPLVIAVTGSNGKTTTKEMLSQIFREHLGRGCIATEKNYNNHIGLPFTLFAIGAATRAAVVEIGMNHAGEISYLSHLAMPHIAVISSIGHAHIEFFRSRAGIAAAKAEIIDGMLPGGALYVPKAIAEVTTVAAAAKRRKISLHKTDPAQKNGVALQIVSQSPTGFQLSLGKERVLFPYANNAWVSNLALAAAVAGDAGVPVTKIAAAIRKFKPAAGRMQLKKGYFQVIDDGYNANPDSAVASIAAALQIADGRPVVCVFGDFKELGKFSKALHAWTGKEAAKAGISAFYGVGSDMRHAVTAYRQAAAKKAPAYLFARDQVANLVQKLKGERKGSVILVKGSRSMKMEEIVSLLTE